MKLRGILSGIAVAALALGGVLLTATPASAASIVVDTDDDGNTGMTLRAAIEASNATPVLDDVITFSPALANNTIQLDPLKGTLIVTDGVTITGLGNGQLTLAGAGNAVSQLMRVQMAEADQDFTLTGITMQGGTSVTGLRVGFPTPFPAHDVTVSDVSFNQFSNSGAGMGMAVFTITGDLTIGAVGDDTSFTGNRGASGSALAVSNVAGDVTITDTLFANNRSAVETPGVAMWINTTSDVVITGTVFDTNTGVGSGGGAAIWDVDSVEVTASTFVNNEVIGQTTLADGGGLYLGDNVGPATITDTVFEGNLGARGGGLAWEVLAADSSITGSSFIGNTSSSNSLFSGGGGAVYALTLSHKLEVTDTLFDGNVSNAAGGGIGIRGIQPAGELAVTGSTFAGNAADDDGLSIWVDDVGGPIALSQSTFDEIWDQDGEAVFGLTNLESSTTTIENSTIVGLRPFAIMLQDQSELLLSHSILATAGVELPAGMLAGAEWSLFASPETDNAVAPDAAGNQFSADPKLAPLADNGGATPTRLPLPGSPAIDRGQPGDPGPAATDQRGAGFARVIHQVIDIGAVEAPFTLAATGSSMQLWVPVGGGMLLLAGLAGLLVSRLRQRPANSCQ